MGFHRVFIVQDSALDLSKIQAQEVHDIRVPGQDHDLRAALLPLVLDDAFRAWALVSAGSFLMLCRRETDVGQFFRSQRHGLQFCRFLGIHDLFSQLVIEHVILDKMNLPLTQIKPFFNGVHALLQGLFAGPGTSCLRQV